MRRHAAQRPLGGVVAEADAAVPKEPAEGGPPLQHVIHRLGHRPMARQLRPRRAYPSLQFRHQRGDTFPPHGEALLGRQAVDVALGGEDLIDPSHRLDRQWRFPQLSQFEELAPPVRPAARLGHRPRSARDLVKATESPIGVGLENALPRSKVLPRVSALALPCG